jgi:hypothetical protein
MGGYSRFWGNLQLAAMTGRNSKRSLLLVCLAFAAATGAEVVDGGGGVPDVSLPVTDLAAALAVRGETVQARHLLASSPDSGSPAALFVLTCIELEEGHTDAASHALARLRTVEPHAPETLVLTQLAEERRRSPHGAWTDALVSAWNSADRPHRTDGALLAASARQPPVSAEALAAVGDTPDAFLLAFARSEAEPGRLLDSALSVASVAHEPYAAQLVALTVLSSDKLAEAKRATAQAAARQLLGQLSAAHRENGYLAMGVVLGVPPVVADPLSASQVAGIEDAVKRPAFELPIRPLFVAFRDAYQRIDAGQSSPMAFSETVGALPLDVHVALSRRVEATVVPELRRRAVTALDTAGARLSIGRTLLERMIGASLQIKAAQLRGDAAGAEAGSKRRKQLQGLVASMAALTDYGWPIASFWRDWLERCSLDEVAVAESISP